MVTTLEGAPADASSGPGPVTLGSSVKHETSSDQAGGTPEPPAPANVSLEQVCIKGARLELLAWLQSACQSSIALRKVRYVWTAAGKLW